MLKKKENKNRQKHSKVRKIMQICVQAHAKLQESTQNCSKGHKIFQNCTKADKFGQNHANLCKSMLNCAINTKLRGSTLNWSKKHIKLSKTEQKHLEVGKSTKNCLPANKIAQKQSKLSASKRNCTKAIKTV
jgi:hypothetical protein